MPPYFLYRVLPEAWADWCCETPDHLTYVFSGLSIVISTAAILLILSN